MDCIELHNLGRTLENKASKIAYPCFLFFMHNVSDRNCWTDHCNLPSGGFRGVGAYALYFSAMWDFFPQIHQIHNFPIFSDGNTITRCKQSASQTSCNFKIFRKKLTILAWHAFDTWISRFAVQSPLFKKSVSAPVYQRSLLGYQKPGLEYTCEKSPAAFRKNSWTSAECLSDTGAIRYRYRRAPETDIGAHHKIHPPHHPI